MKLLQEFLERFLQILKHYLRHLFWNSSKKSRKFLCKILFGVYPEVPPRIFLGFTQNLLQGFFQNLLRWCWRNFSKDFLSNHSAICSLVFSSIFSRNCSLWAWGVFSSSSGFSFEDSFRKFFFKIFLTVSNGNFLLVHAGFPLLISPRSAASEIVYEIWPSMENWIVLEIDSGISRWLRHTINSKDTFRKASSNSSKKILRDSLRQSSRNFFGNFFRGFFYEFFQYFN